MTKALAILGIVGVALAALFAFALSGPFVPLLALAFLVVCAILLFTQRSTFTTITGVVLLLLAVSALLYFNPVTGKDGQAYIPDLPPYFEGPWMATLVVIGCIALVLAARDSVGPPWTGYLGLAAGVLAILLVAFVPTDQQGNFANPLGIGVAVLVLFLLFPLVALLRGPPAAVAPTVRRSEPTPAARTVRK
jgi:hypothetical protein